MDIDRWGPRVDIPSPHIPAYWPDYYIDGYSSGDPRYRRVPEWHPEGGGDGEPGQVQPTEGDGGEERQEGNPHGGEGT